MEKTHPVCKNNTWHLCIGRTAALSVRIMPDDIDSMYGS